MTRARRGVVTASRRAGAARCPACGREQGFATVAVLGLLVVLVAVSSLVATLGAVAVTRHRAAAAADLAALAGAVHALEGPDQACAAAARVASAQAATVRSCVLDGPGGLDVRVEVAVRPPGRLGALGSAVAVARAGPDDGR